MEKPAEPAIVLVAPSTGETFTVGPITIRVLEDGTNTDNRLGAVEITVPPGTDQTPQHYHNMHDETFLVTKGKVRFTTGEHHDDVDAGGYVVAPVRAPHTFSNPFAETAVFFNTFTPAYYVNYLRQLSSLEATGGLSPERILAVMA
ncbi:cupin domain-containing protein, partial [uncultured Hymenobacter sp.]|uniref:cupin domain-containing protein n=1 Tax=uncultured Hymenobacter sp. TaxID=170016 RepID=UPI0035C9AEA4